MPDPSKPEPAMPEPSDQLGLTRPHATPRPAPLYPGLPTGTGIGKYRILERVRTAHNAVIYRARDGMLDRLVIIKQMLPELIDNPIACGLFKREAQFLARLPRNTPYIVGIHELIEDEVGLFIVEEHVSGHVLESLIAKRQISLPRALQVFKAAAQGLRLLHALGIVHRALHPGGIIAIQKDGAKITDLSTAAHESDTTPPPVIFPKYSAPEFLRGADYDDRIDIYSLGMVAYEMFVGRPALHRCVAEMAAETREAVARWSEWHLDERAALPLASDLNPAVPRLLSAIIHKMTAKNLDERFGSLQDALAAFVPFDAPQSPGPTTLFLPSLPAVRTPDYGLLPVQPPHTPQAVTGPLALPSAIQSPYGAASMSLAASTQTVRLRSTPQPPAPPGTARPSPDKFAAPVPPPPLPHKVPRRPHHVAVIRHPPPIRTVPTPQPVVEVHKERHPHLVAWLVGTALSVVALAAGAVVWWASYYGNAESHPIRAAVSEGTVALDNRNLELADKKLREAAEMHVRNKALTNLRDQAEGLLVLVQAERALAEDRFDIVEERLAEARQRGADPARIDDIQGRMWNRKDAYRLEAEGLRDLDHGNVDSAELLMDEYKQNAQAAGVSTAKLRNRIDDAKTDGKYGEALKRASTALDNGDFDKALQACQDAEAVRITAETRELHKQILDYKQRSELILRGDEAFIHEIYADAALAYEQANKIQASKEVEGRARLARAYLLYYEALAEVERGNLLEAERRLKTSLWNFNIEEARKKLAKLAPAFDAARTVNRADVAMRSKDYLEAEHLYKEALPKLPEPAASAVRDKLVEVQRAAAASSNGQTNGLRK